MPTQPQGTAGEGPHRRLVLDQHPLGLSLLVDTEDEDGRAFLVGDRGVHLLQGDPDGVARVSVSTARLGRDMLAQSDPPLRFAWVERGNALAQNPETHAVGKAIRAREVRVVVDQFLTDTAREADLVLPAECAGCRRTGGRLRFGVCGRCADEVRRQAD